VQYLVKLWCVPGCRRSTKNTTAIGDVTAESEVLTK
jgi:hypothetical protein